MKTGLIGGQQKSWREGVNDYKFLFNYNDRGRGDTIYAEVKTNNEGLIVSLR
ncbi:MAG: hypothetical protein M3R36_00745 [Bacteroidota bacterium]|nr:hypothetical protein [Bacteroidota bacterium]